MTISGPFVKQMKASGRGEQVQQWLWQGRSEAFTDPRDPFCFWDPSQNV